MSYDITGKVVAKFDTQQKTEKFSAREFVIEINESQYPQMVKFQLTNDRCSIIDPYNEGDQIKVHFDLRGREWQGKYFTNLNAWRIESATGQSADDTPVFNDNFPTAEDTPSQNNDDLPF